MTRQATVLGLAAGMVFCAGAAAADKSPWATTGVRTLVKTSFEAGEFLPDLEDHTLVTQRKRTGKQCLSGSIDKPQTGCFLRIPFASSKGKRVRVSFWVMGDRGTTATMFVGQTKARKDRVRVACGKVMFSPGKWQQVQGVYRVDTVTRGWIEIIAPAGWSGKVGRVWIDDLVVTESADQTEWPECVEDFPALACDEGGTLWMALLDRPIPRKRISVFRFEGGTRKLVCSFEPKGVTGLHPPAVAGLDEGCVVAFPVEQDDRWRIAVAFLDGKTSEAPKLTSIETGGNANVDPVLAVADGKAWVLWESNAGASRGIYASCVTPEGAGKPQRLSAAKAYTNSYNPAVVATDDGALFAAWDSFRDQGADIYGAVCRDGTWEPERRLTRGRRIERHPSLATRGGQVWMAWQAQSYPMMKLNAIDEQRVVVARVDDGKLVAPLGLFGKVSPASDKLLRPAVTFDDSGRLWVIVRKSAGKNAGWRPEAWCYSGRSWSGPHPLLHQQGRWRPVATAQTPGASVAAVQYDDRDPTQGIRDDWRSGVAVVALPTGQAPPFQPLATVPLTMPATDFSVAQKMDLVATTFPRQTWTHAGEDLKLYWGDFHDHTDLSICGRAVNPPGHDLYANVRDLERLDFAALTDHAYNLDRPQWAYNGEQTRANHDPGRFVAFLGQEWTSKRNPPAGGKVTPKTPQRYGHRNLVFLDPYYHRFYDAMDGDITPRDLWNQIKGVEYITIPHQIADWKGKGGGNPPTDWGFTDEDLQPVAEIYQARQSYEYLGCPRQAPQGTPFRGYYLQDAWATGIIIGVIASPDHGGGNGKVAVWAKDLTRKSILDAVRARHCYGTSGAKMGLWFSAGTARMGDKVRRTDGPIRFHVKARAMRDIKELVIFRNNEIVHRVNPNAKQVEVDWTDDAPPKDDRLWYYARIQAIDEELAWASPIWFLK